MEKKFRTYRDLKLNYKGKNKRANKKDGLFELGSFKLGNSFVNSFKEHQQSLVISEYKSDIYNQSCEFDTTDIWIDVKKVLDRYGIVFDLETVSIDKDNSQIKWKTKKLYDFEGVSLCVWDYMKALGNKKQKSDLLVCSLLVEQLYEAEYLYCSGEFKDACQMLTRIYKLGKLLQTTEMESDYLAGQSRTGEASRQRMNSRKEKSQDAIKHATGYIKSYKKAHNGQEPTKEAIYQNVAKIMGCNKDTVRKSYLHGIDIKSL